MDAITARMLLSASAAILATSSATICAFKCAALLWISTTTELVLLLVQLELTLWATKLPATIVLQLVLHAAVRQLTVYSVSVLSSIMVNALPNVQQTTIPIAICSAKFALQRHLNAMSHHSHIPSKYSIQTVRYTLILSSIDRLSWTSARSRASLRLRCRVSRRTATLGMLQD